MSSKNGSMQTCLSLLPCALTSSSVVCKIHIPAETLVTKTVEYFCTTGAPQEHVAALTGPDVLKLQSVGVLI